VEHFPGNPPPRKVHPETEVNTALLYQK